MDNYVEMPLTPTNACHCKPLLLLLLLSLFAGASKVIIKCVYAAGCHAAQWYDKCVASPVLVCVSHMDRVTIVPIGMNSGRALTTADILFILRQPIVLLLPVNKQEHYYTKY